MRVFEFFTYNLKEIKFKDTKPYFDRLLETLNLKYTDIKACLRGDNSGNICQKVTKAFPQLSEYVAHLEESALYFKSCPEHCFSSIKNYDGQTYIKAEHLQDFNALLKRIPHSINFPFMGVVLDNVNWFGDTPQTPVFSPRPNKMGYYDHKFRAYYSNSIRLFKEFDFGTKLNLVEIVIEREVTTDGLEPYPPAFQELLSKLGKPKNINRVCVFTDAEKATWENAAREFEQFVKENVICMDAFSEEKLPTSKKEYLMNSITPISGFSPKIEFNKVAKVKGYTFHSCRNGCYRYQYINPSNHTFVVELMNIPLSSFFDGSVSIQGYNFQYPVRCTPQVTIKDANSAKAYAEKVFDVAQKANELYTEKLASLYGRTPEWYIND